MPIPRSISTTTIAALTSSMVTGPAPERTTLSRFADASRVDADITGTGAGITGTGAVPSGGSVISGGGGRAEVELIGGGSPFQ
jgi:hypothetical protein